MNKKTVIIVFLIIVALLVVFYVVKKSNINEDGSAGMSTSMKGVVSKVDGQSITVEGTVSTQDNGSQVNRTIQFEITPATIFKKSVITFGSSTREDKEGSFHELKTNTVVLSIKSTDDLFKKDLAEAIEVYYSVPLEFPQ